MREMKNRIILLIHCCDQPGIVWKVTEFINQRCGNILELEQHVDDADEQFFMRVDFAVSPGADVPELMRHFEIDVALTLNFHWRWFEYGRRQRLALFVSKESHCLLDILARTAAREWPAEVGLVVSNHEHWRDMVAPYSIPFCHIPIIKGRSSEAAQRHQAVLLEYSIDCVVLARYMQIIPPELLVDWQWKMINIHHSFLPAFEGARPYHHAFQRGVKLIGATAHYVTESLDKGPIIAQDVIKARHTDTIDDLSRKGRDVEKIVLARALWHHLRNDLIVYKNKVIVFGE